MKHGRTRPYRSWRPSARRHGDCSCSDQPFRSERQRCSRWRGSKSIATSSRASPLISNSYPMVQRQKPRSPLTPGCACRVSTWSRPACTRPRVRHCHHRLAPPVMAPSHAGAVVVARVSQRTPSGNSGRTLPIEVVARLAHHPPKSGFRRRRGGSRSRSPPHPSNAASLR
jgi:hypothetical protein